MYLLRLDPHLPWQPVAVEAAKRALYDGFRGATQGAPPGNFGVVVDERSTLILRDAASSGYTTVCTIGAIGNREFDNEVDDGMALHPLASRASYWRVLVRFNPAEDKGLTPLQLGRLRRLSASLARRPGPRLLCDLVVPPTQWQLVRGIRAFDRELLPELTSVAIGQLMDAGVVPALWGIEGFEHRHDYEQVMTAVTRDVAGAGCLVRAAGHSEATTFELMSVGLSTRGIVGVVLGPAPFWDPVAAWMFGRTTRARAVASVEEQFRTWVTRLDANRLCLTHEEQV